MQNTIVNVNGQIQTFDPAKAHLDYRISTFDRSYLYGDSLYEVARTYGGRFFALDEHLRRLELSGHLCKMEFKQSLAHYKAEMQRSLELFYKELGQRPGPGAPEAYCRIVISRGEGKIGFGNNCVASSTLYTIIVQKLDEPSSEQLAKGYKMQISRRLRNDPRALDPAMKSGNYLNSLLAYLDAAEERFDDALLVNYDDFLTEGTTFNLFYVNRGIIATPPLDIGILDGITRRKLIDLAREIGLEVREVRFPRERLYEADEVFLSSTIKEAFPITQVDEHKIGKGKPGPITMRLRAEFQKRVKAEMGT